MNSNGSLLKAKLEFRLLHAKEKNNCEEPEATFYYSVQVGKGENGLTHVPLG